MTLKLEVDASKPLPAVLPDFDDFYESANIVSLSDKISCQTALQAVDAIAKSDRSLDICFSLNSVGGCFEWAMELAGFLEVVQSEGIEVRIVAEKYCMSSALAILMSVPPQFRYCTAFTKFVIHSSRFSTDDGMIITDLSAREISEIRTANFKQCEYLLGGSRIAEASLLPVMETYDDILIGADEALELGLVAAIID